MLLSRTVSATGMSEVSDAYGDKILLFYPLPGSPGDQEVIKLYKHLRLYLLGAEDHRVFGKERSWVGIRQSPCLCPGTGHPSLLLKPVYFVPIVSLEGPSLTPWKQVSLCALDRHYAVLFKSFIAFRRLPLLVRQPDLLTMESTELWL